LVGTSADPTDPADHATLASGLAIAIFLALRRQGLMLFSAALLLGFASVYVGRQIPGDILASAVIGGGLATCVRQLRAQLGWLLVPAFHVLARLRLVHAVDAQAGPGCSKLATGWIQP
jgi:hypothetical protein